MNVPNSPVSVQISDLVQVSLPALAGADYVKMYEIAAAVSKNPALAVDFDADPLAAAQKINGFVPPPGFHMHIVDGNNVYHPKENDALTQISTKSGGVAWTRVEVRAGVDNMACIICVWCKPV
jgi:hypothetical protein